MPGNRKLAYLVVFVLFLLGVLYVVFNGNGVLRYTQLNSELDSLQVRIDWLTQENTKLHARIDSLQKKQPAIIEETAREKYGMKREGEKVIKVEQR